MCACFLCISMCAPHTAVYYRMYNCKFSSQALRGFVFFSIVSKISKKYMSGLKKKIQEMLTLSRGIDDYILVMFQIPEGLWSFDLLEVKGQNQRPRGFEHKAAYCIATACMYTVLQSYRWGKGCYRSALCAFPVIIRNTSSNDKDGQKSVIPLFD